MRISRGEIWSVAWTGFAGKPCPALVIQAEGSRLQTLEDAMGKCRMKLCGKLAHD